METNKSIKQKQIILNEFSECPFSQETLNFYLYIEKKFGTGTKGENMFSLYWKFLSDNGLINKNMRRITKQRYINWINNRYGLNITNLQPNVSKPMLIGLKEFLNEYNKILKTKNKKNEN
jgi:hypothetical protein